MAPSNPTSIAHLILRIGIAFAFLYPPIAALSDPVSWAGYFPAFIRSLPIDIYIILHVFGALEVAIALWLFSGWRLRIPATLAAILLLAIVVFNPSNFEVLFRDLSIAAMALALVLWPETNEGYDLGLTETKSEVR
jgi:uncharacterized membrane protein YphA (DoxX/SURF4 family)